MHIAFDLIIVTNDRVLSYYWSLLDTIFGCSNVG